jgi:hypothetical protein
MVRCTGACLGLAHSQRPRLVLATEALRVLAPRDLSQMCKYEMPIWMKYMRCKKWYTTWSCTT